MMKAALAFPILAFTSLPVPLFVSTMLPRYVKDCYSSRTSSCNVIAFVSGCVKEKPDRRQSQDQLVVHLNNIYNNNTQLCGYDPRY